MSRTRRLALEGLAVFLFCAAVLAYLQFRTPFLPEEDGYYHLKLAWVLRHRGLLRDGFPWAWFSLWREGFSDGSPLFHLWLVPFTFGDLAFGGKLATVLLGAAMAASFYLILALNEVRARLYWFCVFLLGGGYFWWRMMMPRPQVLSVLMLLWSVHFLLNGRRRAFALMSFLYPLSYVAAFLPQVFSVLRWAYLKAVERRDERRLVLTGFLAYALAVLVHPYFPKNLRFFFVQNFYVMYLALTQKVNLYLAGEFLPLDTRQFLGAHVVVIAHLLALAFVLAHRRTALSERTRALMPMAAAAVALTCGSKRFVEYSVPLCALLAAFLFTDLSRGYGKAEFERDWGAAGRAALLVLLAALGLAAGVEASMLRADLSKVAPPRFEALARTLNEKVPPGELVYTCDWDEPPELFFYADRFRYPVIMDPTFMYYWDPGVWRKWFDVANARLTPEETRRTLTETFAARYGLCAAKFAPFRALVGRDPRFRVLAEDAHGFVFELTPDRPR
ncbi:MAG: hypothetical protein HY079_01040 [Elusimicrobia bacterium]|nr:hypothetical protein [Elusimicrobiota bacterium]